MADYEPTLTVAQLVKLLETMPQDAEVITEGCDCDGCAGAVEYRPDSKDVYIWRSKMKHETAKPLPPPNVFYRESATE